MEVGEAAGRRKRAGGIDWGPVMIGRSKCHIEKCWWQRRNRSLGKTEDLGRTARWNNGGRNSETAAVKWACMRQDSGRMRKEQWMLECNYGDARAAGSGHRRERTRNARPLGDTICKTRRTGSLYQKRVLSQKRAGETAGINTGQEVPASEEAESNGIKRNQELDGRMKSFPNEGQVH